MLASLPVPSTLETLSILLAFGAALAMPMMTAAAESAGEPNASPVESAPVASAEHAAVEHYTSPGLAALGLPFSEAVRVGDLVFLSGTLGIQTGKAELVPGGVEAETEQALGHIRRTLEHFGAGLDDVVKCTVMLADIAEWPRVNEVYRRHFRPPYPARSAFGASGLALGARVEIECIARLSP